MAKEQDNAAADPLVQCKVLAAISYGGVAYRPGEKGEPADAVLPESVAKAHGEGYVKIVGPAPAKKAAETPADKQTTGGQNKAAG